MAGQGEISLESTRIALTVLEGTEKVARGEKTTMVLFSTGLCAKIMACQVRCILLYNSKTIHGATSWSLVVFETSSAGRNTFLVL